MRTYIPVYDREREREVEAVAESQPRRDTHDVKSRKNVLITAQRYLRDLAAPSSYSAENDLADIKAEAAKRHNEAVKRLADWIKQVSIAAEDGGFPEGGAHGADGA